MSQTLKAGDLQLDSIEQRILLALEDADEPKSLARLMNETGEKRQSVWYRLVDKSNSLVDTNTVGREEGDTPKYYLTVEGKFIVQEHRDTMELPKSFEEMQSEIRQARQESESAKASVQSYRQKVSRTKRTAKSAEERVEEIEREAASEEQVQRRMMEMQNEMLESMDAQLNSRLGRIESIMGDPSHLERETIVGELSAIYSIVEYHREYLDWLKDTAESETTANKSRIADLDEEFGELESELASVAEDIEENDADEGRAGWRNLVSRGRSDDC